jgi:hypothetical protein
MGKGGANPYPGWWATDPHPVIKDLPPPPVDPMYQGDPCWFRPKDRRYEWEKTDYTPKPNWWKFFNFFDEDPFTDNYGKRSHPRDFFDEEECPEGQRNMNPFDILGVDENTDPKDIKKAYYKLCLIHHPDKGGDQKDFIKIQTAWEYIEMYYL